MFRIFFSFFKQALFWVLFFGFGRMVFLIYYSSEVANNSNGFVEILRSFQKGFNLDLATTCYFMFFPFLLHLIISFYSPKWLSKLTLSYHSVLIILYSLLIVGELGIYAEWRTKINYKALLYLQNPSEVIGSAQNNQIIVFSILALLMSALGLFIYSKFFHTNLIRLQTPPILALLFFIVMPPLLVIGARGGLQEIPINQSQSYYSKHHVLNTAATNSIFNLYISYFENKKHLAENPFKEMQDSEANELVRQIYHTPIDSSTKVLNTERPNIMLIILESWSSDLIFTPDGNKVVAPEFRKLMEEGIYFDQVYSTGFRSEQAMASIFSGFPAHPISSITVQPDKYRNLPSLIKDLNNEGYYTSFYFGGQLIYGNIKSYILFNEFDEVKEIYDFDPNIPRGKLGIHDEFMLTEMVNDANKNPKPFFKALFTLSSHSPYDQPSLDDQITWGGNEQQYLNSAYYTDDCLGAFIRKAKKEEWFDNTLFVFVADHSHNSYENRFVKGPEYQKIPLLFYGNVIDSAYRGTSIHRLGIQTNIVSTLLNQLQLNDKAYHWSVDMLNPHAPEFAYISYEEGFSWVRPVGHFSYEKRFNLYHSNTLPTPYNDSIVKEGKAYMQTLFQEYMDQ